ncbi:hypothetical protein O7599_36655 [Streptomyces sp. WMMC500]|uniref:hypothetical protein n=1 Tax=Streptomyces sp. WMMC500 TaxID=3015154 RepID=UPI00248D3107|nr:hypothetical protein [Streptomyces sp. WMMC500]WBB60955.1 hypothetical protein O7599_36655 [Streptomyces sp. WMMC500]
MKFLDLPLVQRFLGNRWAIGAACALMVVTGVVAAMLTTGGPEPVSDAKSAVRDTAAEAAQPGKPAETPAGKPAETQPRGKEAAEPQSRPQESAKRGEQPPAVSGRDHRSPHRSSGHGHRLRTSFDNGTVFVGGAVAPGTYATRGSNGEPGGCRWARLADNGGELVPIISGSTSGPTHLTVHHGEYVRSNGCQTWSRTHHRK